MKVVEFLINKFLWIRVLFLIKFNSNIDKKPRILNTTHELTFIDDFKKNTLLRDLWRTDFFYGLQVDPVNIITDNNAPDIIYTNVNHVISDGKIYLYTKKENVKYNDPKLGSWTIPYSSGQIQQLKFEQKYGYFEASISLSELSGAKPDFSLCTKLHNDLHILEHLNSKLLKDNLNVYGIDWQSNYIKFYWNNILVKIIYNKDILKEYTNPMFISINNGIDISLDSKIELPSVIAIDWVRVWTKR